MEMKDPRPRFEALLTQRLKQIARRNLEPGERAIPEFPATFRAGVKTGLQLAGVIKQSTTELPPEKLEEFRIFLERLNGNVPPVPESPFDTSPQTP